MKYLIFLLLSTMSLASRADNSSPVGVWTILDGHSGKPAALLQIADQGAELKGTLIKLFDDNGNSVNEICTACPGERKGQAKVGMQIMWGLHRDGDGWGGGYILDPDSGDTYKASLHLADGGSKLKVRGYIGISLLGRTEVWLRAP